MVEVGETEKHGIPFFARHHGQLVGTYLLATSPLAATQSRHRAQCLLSRPHQVTGSIVGNERARIWSRINSQAVRPRSLEASRVSSTQT